MRRVAMLTTFAAGLAGCGSESEPTVVSGSCVAVVRWHGALYYGTSDRARPAGDLGKGVRPACNDTNLADEEDTPIRLARDPRLSPKVAVVEDGERYVRWGAVMLRDGGRLVPEGARCARPRNLQGVLTAVPPQKLILQTLRDDVHLEVRGPTDLEAFEVEGIPIMPEGRRVKATVRECVDREDGTRPVVAVRVVPL